MAIFCTCMHVDCTKTQHTHSVANIVFIHFTNDNVNNLSLNEKKIQWKWLDSMNQKRQRHATIIILFRIIARICVFSLCILRSGYTHKLKIVVHIAQCPPPPLPPLLITLLKYFHQEIVSNYSTLYCFATDHIYHIMHRQCVYIVSWFYLLSLSKCVFAST